MQEEHILKSENEFVFSDIRFLIVDDLPVNLKMLEYFIEGVGGIISKAEDGLSAIELFKENTYDVIVMDVQMPNMTGIEAAKEIRKLPGGQNVAIIGLSANTYSKDRQACLDAGMDDFIPKPLRFESFVRIVKQSLDRTIIETDIPEQKPENNINPLEKNDFIQPIDIEAYINRMGGNKEIAKTIIKGFLNLLPDSLDKIEEAIRTHNVEILNREAHSIKGGALNIFAEQLMIAAKELEINARIADQVSANVMLDKIRKEYNLLYEYVGTKLTL